MARALALLIALTPELRRKASAGWLPGTVGPAIA
jgi:hypothetical protein